MPKTSLSKSVLYRSWILGDPNFKVEGDKLFCLLCMKSYHFNRKGEFTQHKMGLQHAGRVCSESASRQKLLTEVNKGDQQKKFEEDVVWAFLQEGIPLQKLENGPLRELLTKYTNFKLPSVSTLRRSVPAAHEQSIAKVRMDIGDSRIWISVDEATDSMGRNIAHVIVGKLVGDVAGKGNLIHVAELEKTNASTIVQTVQEALEILWKEGSSKNKERLLILVTDSVAYMLKAGKTLKMLYPKLVHYTCLSHGLHRVAEAVREEHPLANKLISNGKKIFLKAPLRIDKFKQVLPGVRLPPEPVVTRCGTWLDAAMYYHENLEGFRKVVLTLEDDAACIKTTKTLLQDTTLANELLFIRSNFAGISRTIEELQKADIPLTSTVEKVEAVVATAAAWPGDRGRRVKEKLQAVLQRNCGWQELVKLATVFKGEDGELPSGWTQADAFAAKYDPGTSADVERSFSKLNYLLSDRRLGLTIENVKFYMTVFFNQ